MNPQNPNPPVSHSFVQPLGVLVSLTCLLFAASVAHAQNFLKNSSFEDSIGSTNWTFVKTGNLSSSATTDATQFHWEEQSLKLTYTGSSTPQTGVYSQLKQTVTNLTVGKTYYAYLWVKGQSVGSSTTLEIKGVGQASTAIPTGTYDWQLLECIFTADSTSLQAIVTLNTTTGALWVDDGYLTENRRCDVSTLGIPGNNTDVTAAISSALATYKFLYFPPGTYSVTGAIILPKGAIIQGAGDTTIFKQVTANLYATFTASGDDSTFVGDNEFTAFKTTGGNINYIAYYKTARNVLMRHCTVNPGHLLRVATHKASYSDITAESQLSANIRVSFCNAAGPNMNGYQQDKECVSLSYVVDGEVYKNTMRFYGMGVKIWGGNATFGTSGGNGDMINPRWARRHYVAGNTLEDMHSAGVFICMGQYVTVELNTANRAGDVVIDFEGCFDSIANDNVVSDGVNGALSSFYGTQNLTFRRNIVTSNIAGYPLYRMYNSSYEAGRVLNVVLEENTFKCTSGLASVDDYKGPGHLTIRNNTFTNAVIDISHRGMGTSVPPPTITGNTMTFTLAMSQPATAINLKVAAAGTTTVSGNTIKWTNTTGRTTKTGIMYRRVLAGPQIVDIEDNYILGCMAAGIDIYYDEPHLTAEVHDNRVGSTSYVGAQGQVILNASNNQDLSGHAKPPLWVP